MLAKTRGQALTFDSRNEPQLAFAEQREIRLYGAAAEIHLKVVSREIGRRFPGRNAEALRKFWP